MTVSTITGIPAADVKRAQDQNRTTSQVISEQTQSASAGVPQDIIATLPSAAPIFNFQEAVDQTALQNRAAAQSTLTEADLQQIQVQPDASQQVAAKPTQSVAAQTGKLPADLLQLLNE